MFAINNYVKTSRVLIMVPEVSDTARRVTCSYALLETSDGVAMHTYELARQQDVTLFPALIERRIVGPVLANTLTHKLFVRTPAGLAPLSAWV